MTFAKVFTALSKVLAALIFSAVIIVFISMVFLVRSCDAPLYNHTVEIYLRNKSNSPLSVSFTAPTKDVILDTIYWIGGKQRTTNDETLYLVRGSFLNTSRMGYGEIFNPHRESLLIQGSTDTVYYTSQRKSSMDYLKETGVSLATASPIPNPRFINWKKKLTPLSQLPQALYSDEIPYTHPPLMLEHVTADWVRFTFQVLAQDSLLVASKSEAFHASDPSYVSRSDFALTSVLVHWTTLANKHVYTRLPAKAHLEALLRSAPDSEATKFYSCIQHIDYK